MIPKTTPIFNSSLPQSKKIFRRLLSHEFSHVQKVAIIGAGVAGLQVANRLAKIGLKCTVFEKARNVGGVWQDNYAGFGLQVPRQLFEFPEYPYPADMKWDRFPLGPQVQKYIELYANHNNLFDVCEFNTEVVKMTPKDSEAKGWNVTYKHNKGKIETKEFDFCVVATGMYNWPPYIPQTKDSEMFDGDILHSSDFRDSKMATGKKVIVVGGGKSAIDIAVESAKVANESINVARKITWGVPRYIANLIPFQWCAYSRIIFSSLPLHYETSPMRKLLHSLFKPLKIIWWRIAEVLFSVQFGYSREFRPKTPIDVELFGGGQILNYDFRNMLREGKIKRFIGTIDRFTKNGVVLSDGKEIDADMVIYGTGFGKDYQYFDHAIQEKLNIEKDGLYLYRHIISPKVPGVAFIGSEVSTFNNILTQGLQALWLQKIITGDLELPSVSNMQKSVEEVKTWKRSWMPESKSRASLVQLHMMKYHDQLCKDMGVPTRRKGKNILAEIFAPYNARDYSELFKIKDVPDSTKEEVDI